MPHAIQAYSSVALCRFLGPAALMTSVTLKQNQYSKTTKPILFWEYRSFGVTGVATRVAMRSEEALQGAVNIWQ
jgi:hypothetical protein